MSQWSRFRFSIFYKSFFYIWAIEDNIQKTIAHKHQDGALSMLKNILRVGVKRMGPEFFQLSSVIQLGAMGTN